MNIYKFRFKGYEDIEEKSVVAENIEQALKSFLETYEHGDSSHIDSIFLVAQGVVFPKQK